MSKDPGLNLVHIIEAIGLIKDFLGDDREKFLDNNMAYQAVLRKLQTMSESCGRLPDSIKSLYSEIDWKEIRGFRNILVHDYLDDINPQIVWNAIQNNLPAVKEMALIELKKLGYDMSGKK